MYCNRKELYCKSVQWLEKLYCNREVCWLGHYIAIHQGVLWLRRQGLWDKRVTIQLLYCDIEAGLRQSVLQYTEGIVTEAVGHLYCNTLKCIVTGGSVL